MQDQLISISETAKRLGRDRRSLLRTVRRMGIEPVLLKSAEGRGQKVAHITVEEYDQLEAALGTGTNTERNTGTSYDHGFFYLIQLEPDLDPNRVKVGFATSVDERLRAHMTSAPHATLIAAWPCQLLWEKTAIDCITEGAERLYTEVFRVTSVEDTEARADAFFEVMPCLSPIDQP